MPTKVNSRRKNRLALWFGSVCQMVRPLTPHLVRVKGLFCWGYLAKLSGKNNFGGVTL